MGNPIEESFSTFADNSELSSWAQTAVGQMQISGIMSGIGHNQFDPKSAYTREQSIITIKRMDVQIVPCEKIELTASDLTATEPVQIGQQCKISASIFPENVTNKNLIWSSSDETIATVDSTGSVKGVKPGSVQITATAVNGISSSIGISICDYVILPTTSIEINCVKHERHQYNPSVDYLPDELLYAGSIILNDYTVEYNRPLVSGEPTFRIRVSGKVSAISKDVEYLSSYVKWILRDLSGNIIDSGLEYDCHPLSQEIGDEVLFIINVPNHSGACTIEFFGDDGGRSESEIEAEAFTSSQANAPTIELPQLPFTLSTSVVITTDEKDRFGNQKAQMVDRDTLSIDEINYEVTGYDRKSDCYEIELFCSGTVYYPLDRTIWFSWRLFDSDGKVVDYGLFYALDGNCPFTFSSESMGTAKYLYSGEEYTLTLQPSR